MIIRRVRKEDIESFVEVYQKAYRGLEEYAYTRRRDIKYYFKWLYARDKDGFMVAEIDGKAVGFLACDTNWISIFEAKRIGEIHEIFVLPEYQKMGIGTSLMIKALIYIKSRGLNEAGLWVGEKNYKAIKFYKKFGFRDVGVWGRWIRMVKELDE